LTKNGERAEAAPSIEGGNVMGKSFKGATGEVKLVILDPGHFHAALVQKTMYAQVSPTVHVYAPEGPELQDYLSRVQGFNHRAQDPASWDVKLHTGPDFLEQMLKEKPGNVVVVAGNNRRKTEYLKACVDAGLNVFSDKPMCIDAAGWKLLKETFAAARKKSVLLYDIMTERFEITSMLQKELVHLPAVFGALEKGTVEKPAVTKESVHHFFKTVAGMPVQRPAWFVDVTQQGEGIVDVSTHLTDLVMWGCFPGQTMDYAKAIRMIKARRWPTLISRDQYAKMTGLADFAEFLKRSLDREGQLPCYSNGEMVYTLQGIHAKVSVIWNFEAPAGGGDTHYSIMRGSKANVIIEQGKAQNYRPELYCETAGSNSMAELGKSLEAALPSLQRKYPGVEIREEKPRWRILIPDKYRVGHEAHFGQVMEHYLKFLTAGKLPEWEVPNMIAKYYTTTQALELALKSGK